ncbi:MAG: hypothetical protein HRT88_13855 [Lentisphaeraceae bacterium]|nr:hypothetical protein [Lentisphaeraceae bacterium]
MKSLILLFALSILVPSQLSAKSNSKIKPYTKIFSIKKIDGTLEYSVTDKPFKASKDEDKYEDQEKDRLRDEYKEALKAHKEAYAEFKKSKGESEEPKKVFKPRFKFDSRKYEEGDKKDKVKREKDLAKRAIKAEAYNTKLQATKDADAARKERLKRK